MHTHTHIYKCEKVLKNVSKFAFLKKQKQKRKKNLPEEAILSHKVKNYFYVKLCIKDLNNVLNNVQTAKAVKPSLVNNSHRLTLTLYILKRLER